MTQETKKLTIKQQLSSGLSALLLTLSLCVCFGAVTGQGLFFVLICVLWCTIISVLSKRSIFAPHPLFIVPFFFVCFGGSFFGAIFAVSTGACLCCLFGASLEKIKIPDFVFSGAALGICLGATILLTNSYFGIGAFGSTPFEMLKSYRSLGFHPNFMGLLTGTITLFTMITYPFKFRKLRRIIPAPFITILIPFILNLFLNPQKDYTTINEALCLTPVTDFSVKEFISSYSASQISTVIKGAVVFFLVFTAANQKSHQKALPLIPTFPVASYNTDGFSPLSGCIMALISVGAILLFPATFARLPVHCAGSMLIVLAWQSLPFKKIAEVFKTKERRLVSIIGFLVCALSFVFTDAFTAVLISATASLIFRKEAKANEE